MNESPKKLRKILIGAGSILILILAAVSFILIPALVPSQSQELPAFGAYGKHKIEYVPGSFFSTAVEFYDKQSGQQGGQNNPTQFFSTLQRAFSETVLMYAFSDAIEKSGYKIPESLLARSMLPYFHDAKGQYSERIFNETPKSRISEIRKEVSRQLIFGRYNQDMTSIKYSENEKNFISDMNKNKRSFIAALYDTANFPESEVISFGKENEKLFTIYDFSIVTRNTKAETDDILRQLKGNELIFKDAVSQYSTKKYSNDEGKLTQNWYYEIEKILKTKEDLETLVNLTPETYSAVIETSEGFSIFILNTAPVPVNFENNDVVKKIHDYMNTYEAGIIETYFVNQANNFTLASLGKDFKTAAEAKGLKIVDIPEFALNYGNNPLLTSVPDSIIPEITGASTNERFLTQAFSLQKGQISEPITLGKTVMLLSLTEESTEENDNDEGLYNYYASQFDMQALNTYFIQSDKVENNLMEVYISHFLN